MTYTPPAAPTAQDAPATRDEAARLFWSWIKQRPGLDPREYGPGPYYRADARRATAQRHEAARAMEAFEALPYDALALARAFRSAFGGRLRYRAEAGELRYTAGQYWSTEYRAAAAAVLEAYNAARYEQLAETERVAYHLDKSDAWARARGHR